jgi:stress-induced morphogen
MTLSSVPHLMPRRPLMYQLQQSIRLALAKAITVARGELLQDELFTRLPEAVKRERLTQAEFLLLPEGSWRRDIELRLRGAIAQHAFHEHDFSRMSTDDQEAVMEEAHLALNVVLDAFTGHARPLSSTEVHKLVVEGEPEYEWHPRGSIQ